MLAKSVLVTGCDKGIGLELICQLVSKTEYLFAGCLHPEKAREVRAIADSNKHIIVLQLDVTNEKSIHDAINEIEEIVGDDGLNCVINNAGVLHCINSIEDLTADSLMTTYSVNAVGPAMIAKACEPLLSKASSSTSNSLSVSRAAVINISSNFGSMEGSPSFNRDEKLFYSYRSSKIALNMLVKNLSIELRPKGILAVNLNPGWVQTDMGGPNAPQTREETVLKLIQIISTLNEESGLFYNWNGDLLPW